jgi:hypothetical protein
MNIKYNDVIGAFVNTANDEPVTQAELLASRIIGMGCRKPITH